MLRLGKVISLGRLSVIHEVMSFHSGQKYIFKTIAIKENESCVQVKSSIQVIKDWHKIFKLNPRNRCWGMVRKPVKWISIPQKGISGFLAEKYDDDYFNYLVRTYDKEKAGQSDYLKTRWIEIHQMLSALKWMDERNVAHCDIKMENMLIKRMPDGFLLVHLADLGSATQLGEKEAADEEVSPYTPYFTPENEINSTLGLRTVNPKLYNTIKKAIDVFAMGCVLFSTLKGFPPYLQKKLEFPEKSEFPEMTVYPWRTFSKEEAPEEVSSLVLSMIDADSQKRPSAAKAFERFDQFLKNKCPDIYHIIQEKIREMNEGRLIF